MAQDPVSAGKPVPLWLAFIVGRRPKRTVVRAALLAVFCFILFKHVLLPVRVEGKSMEPTYADGSLTFVNALSYVRSEPRRGDIVVVEMTGRSIMYLKRIVALPGETVEFDRGLTRINGQPLYEPYLTYSAKWDMDPKRLGPSDYFVVGDNRSMNLEDHYFGIARREKIVGKVIR